MSSNRATGRLRENRNWQWSLYSSPCMGISRHRQILLRMCAGPVLQTTLPSILTAPEFIPSPRTAKTALIDVIQNSCSQTHTRTNLCFLTLLQSRLSHYSHIKPTHILYQNEQENTKIKIHYLI